MPKTFRIMGLGHVSIVVSDMERSVAFYRDMLGFRVEWEVHNEKDHWVFMSNNSCIIELMEGDPASRKDGHVNHLSLLVGNAQIAKDELEAKGIVFESKKLIFDAELYPKGELFAMFRGPDGERLQIEQIL